VITGYSDNSCGIKTGSQSVSFGCAYKVANDYYATSFTSLAVDCVSGYDNSALLKGVSGTYAVEK
jgi:hypothetical protein